jgi:mevalonate kinase
VSVTIGTASGKVIVFGEHAVVYGRPAIAVPISQVRAHAEVTRGSTGQGIRILAVDLDKELAVAAAGETDALALTVRLTLRHLGIDAPVDLSISIHSDLPVSRGLGSGAAVATATVRALASYFGRRLEPAVQSALVYEVEKIYHGTPSGIDNTVIAFEQPVYFVRGRPPQLFALQSPFTLLVADTGIASSTRAVVSQVRRAWEGESTRYERWFDAIGRIAEMGRGSMETGDWPRLGMLMNENHELLQAIGVSSPALDTLSLVARQAGARGAKLCGAGHGGNMIALVEQETQEQVSRALCAAGAVNVIATRVGLANQ